MIKHSSIVINDFERFLEKPSYTANSMRYLLKKYTTYSFSIIVGEDNYKTLHKWHDAAWLMEEFPFLIYSRMPLEGEKAGTEQKVFYKHHQFFGCELLDISSSSIRRRIQEGKSIEYLTPPAVVKEIKLSKLYKTMINSTNLIVNQDGSIFHLGVKPKELASNVILVGDPGRVELIASFFEHVECKRQNREFVMATGLYKGSRLSVMATGIGTDNIDIVLNEIDALVNVDFDARKLKPNLTRLNLLRLGTCGSFQKHVKPGDLVISKKAYGQDSLMLYYQDFLSKFIKNNKELQAVQQYFSKHHLGPVQYIAETNDSLLNQFKSLGHCGITLTASGFYGPQGRELRTNHLAGWHNDAIANYEDLQGNKVCNLEMECSALYGLGGLLGHKCLTICLAIAQRSTKEVLVDYKVRMKEIIPQVLDHLIECS